jgi:hypothetical protein
MASTADTRNMFQADMEQLLRKFRDLEADRATRIAKQGNVSAASKAQQVENLKKDNSRLKMDLELETRQAKVANTGNTASQIQRMTSQVLGILCQILCIHQLYADFFVLRRCLSGRSIPSQGRS